jgi:hypothetical protein
VAQVTNQPENLVNEVAEHAFTEIRNYIIDPPSPELFIPGLGRLTYRERPLHYHQLNIIKKIRREDSEYLRTELKKWRKIQHSLREYNKQKKRKK